jgi:hypothetical protein
MPHPKFHHKVPFRPGEFVGRSSGDDYVQIKLESVSEREIHATVIDVGFDFGMVGSSGNGFIPGESIILEPLGAEHWTVVKPLNRPWVLLWVGDDGTKHFEHFRSIGEKVV